MSLVVPDVVDLEGVASFLVVERPDLLDASVERQAGVLGVSVGEVRRLWRDAEFRGLVDRFLTWRVLDPGTRLRQLEKLREVSVDGDRDADAIKAFDVLSRQAGLKVPERHEVDDRRSVEVRVEHLPVGEGGFVPSTPFVAPEGRRARLGEKVERQEQSEVVRESGGPFDVVDVEVLEVEE